MDHEALLYSSTDDAATVLAGWAADGLRAGARVALGLRREMAELVIDRLGARAAALTVLPRDEVYRSPARASDRVRALVDDARERPIWCAGEIPWECAIPAWRRGWARYEAVLNETFSDAAGRMLCLYDRARVPDAVCRHARATHPTLTGEGAPNRAYTDPSRYCAQLAADAAQPAGAKMFELRADTDLSGFRSRLATHLSSIGLAGRLAADTVLAVHELVANAIEHGSGDALVRGFREQEAAVIEVEDTGPGGIDTFAGEGAPQMGDARGRGVYLARRLADVLEYPAHPSGCLARIYQVTGA